MTTVMNAMKPYTSTYDAALRQAINAQNELVRKMNAQLSALDRAEVALARAEAVHARAVQAIEATSTEDSAWYAAADRVWAAERTRADALNALNAAGDRATLVARRDAAALAAASLTEQRKEERRHPHQALALRGDYESIAIYPRDGGWVVGYEYSDGHFYNDIEVFATEDYAEAARVFLAIVAVEGSLHAAIVHGYGLDVDVYEAISAHIA